MMPRYILERASARETAARVAAGALAKQLLRALGTEIASHTIQVGHTRIDRAPSWGEFNKSPTTWNRRCVAWTPPHRKK